MRPLFAGMVLPLLGGAPAVWNTSLVFPRRRSCSGTATGRWNRCQAYSDRKPHVVWLGFGVRDAGPACRWARPSTRTGHAEAAALGALLA